LIFDLFFVGIKLSIQEKVSMNELNE
jgi:hypothetical protein